MNIKWINYHDYYKERDKIVTQREEQLLPYYIYGAVKRGSFVATEITASSKPTNRTYDIAMGVEDLFYLIIHSMTLLCEQMVGTRYVPLDIDIDKNEVVFLFDERFKDEFFASDCYPQFVQTFESLKSTPAPKELLERIYLHYEAEKKLNKHTDDLKNTIFYYSRFLMMTDESYMIRGTFDAKSIDEATEPDHVLMDKIVKELPKLRDDYDTKKINVDKETEVWSWKDRPANPFEKIHEDLQGYTKIETDESNDADFAYAEDEDESDDEDESEDEPVKEKKQTADKKVQEELF